MLQGLPDKKRRDAQTVKVPNHLEHLCVAAKVATLLETAGEMSWSLPRPLDEF